MESFLGHLQCNVRAENLGFYRDLMGLLGWSSLYDVPEMLGVGDKNGASVWFAAAQSTATSDYDGLGVNHIAIHTTTQQAVDQVAAFLGERGVAALFDTPRHRPEFSSSQSHTYYQVMFETPDRLLIEVVYIGPKEA